MSVGLKTKIAAGVELNELVHDSKHALEKILNVSIVPPLSAVQFVGRRWIPVNYPYELKAGAPIVALRIQDEPEMASVSIYKRTPDRFSQHDWDFEELCEMASVEVCGERTGLSFALVAAVSLSIARRSRGLIADETRFYTASFDSSPEEFLSSIRVPNKMRDYRTAANRFEEQLRRRKAMQPNHE